MIASTRPVSLRSLALAAAVACALAVFDGTGAAAQQGGNEVNTPSARRAQLVEACILGTHAWQVRLCRKTKKGDPDAFDAKDVSDQQLDRLVKAQETLLASDTSEVAKWVDGKPGRFDPAAALDVLLNSGLKLDARLPVSAATEVLAANAPALPREKVRALASMLQVVLEIDRDGTVLQDLFRFYMPLGLLAGPEDFGIANDDNAFLAVGTDIAPKCCKAPFDTRRAAFQIGLRKVQNWKLKNEGFGPREFADEVLARPDIRPLIPKIKAMKPERILVLGHSYTMKLNWATLSPMNEIVAAAFAKLNPSVEFAHMGHGGMNAVSARDKYLKDALAWKPSRVLVVVVLNTDAEIAALDQMAQAFRAAGAETIVFDQLHPDAKMWANPLHPALEKLAAKGDVTVLEVGRLMADHPDRRRFVCLDGVHCTDPYHKFMAAELLKYLVGARAAKLEK